MIKKYKVTRWRRNEIEIVLVTRETDKTIWFPAHREGKPDRRETKTSSFCKYFDTWSAARNYILSTASSTVDSAEIRLIDAKKDFEKAKAIPLEEPSDA